MIYCSCAYSLELLSIKGVVLINNVGVNECCVTGSSEIVTGEVPGVVPSGKVALGGECCRELRPPGAGYIPLRGTGRRVSGASGVQYRASTSCSSRAPLLLLL